MTLTTFLGFNLFNQFEGCRTKKLVEGGIELNLPNDGGNNWNKLNYFLWSFNLYACDNILKISGFINDQPCLKKEINLENQIKQITSNEKICLILLENDKIFKYEYSTDKLSEVIFRISKTIPIKRSIFGECIKKDIETSICDKITHIAACVSSFVVVTDEGSIYSLPIKIFDFPRHVKIKDLCSGFEHFLILTSNGDVFSWGNGLRGQLGNNNLDSLDTPMLVEAIAGIKIITISAGGWHSAAISAFGDLYVWGNNVNGQLGIEIFKIITLNPEKQIKKKNPTIFSLPQIVDIDCDCSSSNSKNNDDSEIHNCNVIKVKCGARHTIVQMACGKIFGTGWNGFNQLGKTKFNPTFENSIDKFILIEGIDYLKVDDILCGHWCTVFKFKS